MTFISLSLSKEKKKKPWYLTIQSAGEDAETARMVKHC